MANFLRGLFGSSARQADVAPGRAFEGRYGLSPDLAPEAVEALNQSLPTPGALKRAPTLAPQERKGSDLTKSQKLAMFGAALTDAGSALRGGQGGSVARMLAMQAAQRKELEALQRQGAMQELAGRLYADDPEAQLLFAADPEAFVGARAERLKPRTMSGGQTYIDPMSSERFTAPVVEKFDDRMGYYDPESGEARFSERRGPTFQEETGRFSAEEGSRHNRASEEIGRMNAGTSAFSARTGRMAHDSREKAGGYGTPGNFGGSDLSGLSTEDLLNALGN